MRTRTFNNQTWHYNDAEGSWSFGKHVIGCGGNNKAKWMIWDGPCSSREEFNTLHEAMEAVYHRTFKAAISAGNQ